MAGRRPPVWSKRSMNITSCAEARAGLATFDPALEHGSAAVYQEPRARPRLSTAARSTMSGSHSWQPRPCQPTRMEGSSKGPSRSYELGLISDEAGSRTVRGSRRQCAAGGRAACCPRHACQAPDGTDARLRPGQMASSACLVSRSEEATGDLCSRACGDDELHGNCSLEQRNQVFV